MIKKLLFITAISLLLLIPVIPAKESSGQVSEGKKAPWLLFDSILKISYDSEVVNHTVFPPDVAVSIPITVQYKNDMPHQILSNYLLRLLFLPDIILPQVQASIYTVNSPPWADISFSSKKILFSITDIFITAQVNLIIIIHINAPARPYTFRIKAETPSISRIEDAEAFSDLTITPQYIPDLSLICNPSLQAPPNQLTFIPVALWNDGNDITKVTTEIVNINELNGWIIYITPELYLPPNPSLRVNVTFFCIPPFDFEGNQTIELRFTPSRWSNPEETGTPMNVSTLVHFP